MDKDRPEPMPADPTDARPEPMDLACPEQTDGTMMKRLMQAQKMESVGQLAAGLAHDFNNLLCVISNYADFLAKEDLGRTYREDIEQIMTAAERGRKLVEQLVSFAGADSTPAPQEVSLGRVAEKALGMLTRSVGSRIALSMRLDPAAAPVRGDPGRLEQVVVNLVLNARDAISEDGEVVVSVANVSNTSPSKPVLLSVRDNGSGMTAEVKDRLFEAFFTTKAPGEGTGLGLSMVETIVTEAGGRLEIISEPDEGTDVRIYLPASTPPPLRRNSGGG